MDPQSRPAEFSAARGLGAIAAGDPWDPAAVSIRAPPRALSAGRVPQPVPLEPSEAGRVVGGGACVPTSPPRRTASGPRNRRALRGYPTPRRESDWERLGNRVSRPLAQDRAGLAGRRDCNRVGGESVGIPPDPS